QGILAGAAAAAAAAPAATGLRGFGDCCLGRGLGGAGGRCGTCRVAFAGALAATSASATARGRTVAAFATAFGAAATAARGFGFLGLGGFLAGLGLVRSGQPAEQTLDEARPGCRRGRRRRAYGLGRGIDMAWRGLGGLDALDQGVRPGLAFLDSPVGLPDHLVLGLVHQLEAGFVFLEAGVVMAQAFDVVMRRFERFVGNQDEVHLEAGFDLADIPALFVQQEGG